MRAEIHDFEGEWEDNEGDAVIIKGGTMRGPDGTALDLSMGSDGSCSFSVQGQVFEGSLVDEGRILWSDGALWLRTRKTSPSTGDGVTPAADGGSGEGATLLGEAMGGNVQDSVEQRPCEAVEMTSVVARHATMDTAVMISLPNRAKFKHIKRALARHLGSDDILSKGLLSRKVGGRYKACKDEGRIGETKQVLVTRVSLCTHGQEFTEVTLSDGEVSAEDAVQISTCERTGEEDASYARSSSSGSQGFTKARALSLQQELLEGFRAHAFQQRLDALDRIYSAVPGSLEFQQERQELFLSVQSTVLPKYGFEGTLEGVFRMMGAMGRFLDDPEVLRLAKEINQLLGLRSSSQAWSSLSRECQQLDAESTARQGAEAAPSAEGAAQAVRSRARPARVPMVPRPAGGDAKPPPLTLPRLRPPAEPQAGGPLEVAARPGTLDFEAWPASSRQPYSLWVVGSWSGYEPVEMRWQRGLFVSPMTVGPNGWESFQILKNGKWQTTIYPSVPDAGPFEEHTVLGPDNQGHGKNWMIGRFTEEEAAPGTQFAIIAALDKRGTVQLVHWQHLTKS